MIRELDGVPLDSTVWGGKASGLAELLALGLTVPPALCFLPGSVASSHGADVVQRWLDCHPASAYVLRSSSLIEDLNSTAGAGISKTLVGLSGDSTLFQVLAAKRIEPELGGGSIILQVQAECLYAGVAFVDNGVVTVEANFRSITATTSGATPILTARISATQLLLSFDRLHIDQPVVTVLRQVNDVARRAAEVCHGRADIEWVHDGEICHVVQVRPLTRKLAV